MVNGNAGYFFDSDFIRIFWREKYLYYRNKKMPGGNSNDKKEIEDCGTNAKRRKDNLESYEILYLFSLY